MKIVEEEILEKDTIRKRIRSLRSKTMTVEKKEKREHNERMMKYWKGKTRKFINYFMIASQN